MKTLLFLPLVACVSAQVVLPYGPTYASYAATPYAASPIAAPLAQTSQYHSQDELGQFSFGHSSLDQARSETRLWNGQVLGHYSYIDANGEPAVTYYEAGPNGYRIVGANNLPEAPEVSAVEKSVPDYTPEVAAARAEFAQKFEEAKAAAAAAPDDPVPDEPVLKTAEEPAVEVEAEPVPEEVAEPALAAEAEAASEVTVEAVAEEVVEETEAVVEVARKKRQVVLPAIAPALAKTTVETKQYEPVEAAVPADTTKIDLTTKEHEVLTYAPTPIISTGIMAPQVTLKEATGLPLTWGSYPFLPLLNAPSRTRRAVELPLPYLRAVPTTSKVSYSTSHYEPMEAATPADTAKIGEVTKEHELTIPSVRYVQPTVKVEPITYSTMAMPLTGPLMAAPLVTLKAE